MAATLTEISRALEQIDTKKVELKKAFDELQAHSSVLSSFTLSWSDLDSHFSSLQASLNEKFHLLQTFETQSKNPSSSFDSPTQNLIEPAENRSMELVSSRPELIGLCRKMDGIGLRKYLNETSKDRISIRAELPGAFQVSQDPAALVLKAMEGFYSGSKRDKGDKDSELSGLRRSCVLLLEVLMSTSFNLGLEVKEKAKKLAMEWKGKVSMNGKNPLESLGFLHLVAAYGLMSEFDMDDLVDHLAIVGRYKQAIQLCRKFCLGDQIEGLIHKLSSKGKQILAVKLIFEFQLSDKISPVPFLKAYIKRSKTDAKKVCKEGNNSLKAKNEAAAKEIGAIKSVIKAIEDHNLESEYPKEILEKRIEQLEQQAADRKRPAARPSQPQNQPPKKQQHDGNKRRRTDVRFGASAVQKNFGAGYPTVPSYQQSLLQSTGLLPDGSAPYASSSVAPYGISGHSAVIAPYAGSAGGYVLPGALMGLSGNPSASGTNSHLYSSEPQVPSGYYNRPAVYGGYGVPLPPQYQPAYHPQ